MEAVETPIKHEPQKLAAYLDKLPESIRPTIEALRDTFPRVLSDLNRRGALVAVGGAVDKSWPRKDIDFIVAVEEKEGDPKRADFPDRLAYATEDFKITERIVRSLFEGKDEMRFESLPPQMDYEFENPNILGFDGSVTVRSDDLPVPMEFIRSSQEGEGISVGSIVNGPYVILSSSYG